MALKIGIKVAVELNVNKALPYSWRAKAGRARSQTEVEQAQAAEMVRLKRQLAKQEQVVN